MLFLRKVNIYHIFIIPRDETELKTATALSFPTNFNFVEKEKSQFTHVNTGEEWVKGNGGERLRLLHSGDAQTSDPVLEVGPVLHTTSAPAGFSVSPGCKEVVTWRLEAFPPVWRGGSPRWWEPLAQSRGAGGAWRRREQEAGASQGSPRGHLRLLGWSLCRAESVCAPQILGSPAPNQFPGLQSAARRGGVLRQRCPRADATLCGPLTRLRGPSITSIDPGVSGGLRKGSDGARAHGGEQLESANAAEATVAPLRAPRASSGRRRSNNPTTSSSGAASRARLLRHGHARVTTSHAAGSRWEWGQGVGGAQGRRGTDRLARSPSFLSREAQLRLEDSYVTCRGTAV